MLVPACDRPPEMSPFAIVESVRTETFHSGLFTPTGGTSRAPRGGVRSPRVRNLTNAAPDLSITRAKESSVTSATLIELEKYSRFLRGWDGYDGEPIAQIAIDLAKGIVEALRLGGMTSRLTEIIPGPASDGSLDLEFRTDSRSLTLTIYPGADHEGFEIRTFRVSGAETEEKDNIEQAVLVADLRWLLS